MWHRLPYFMDNRGGAQCTLPIRGGRGRFVYGIFRSFRKEYSILPGRSATMWVHRGGWTTIKEVISRLKHLKGVRLRDPRHL